MRVLILIIIYHSIFFLAACNKKEKEIKIPHKYVVYYSESLMLKEKYKNQPDTLQALQKELLASSSIKKEEWTKIKEYFLKNPDTWIKFQELVQQELDLMARKP
jgi:hypothetical protein